MKLLEAVILAWNKTQMDKSLPARLLSPEKQRENKYMPVDTGEGRTEVASGSNEVSKKCGLRFVNSNNATTMR